MSSYYDFSGYVQESKPKAGNRFAVRQSQAEGTYFEDGLVMCICHTREEAERMAAHYLAHRGQSKFIYRVEDWTK